jgi:hypothetical protein
MNAPANDSAIRSISRAAIPNTPATITRCAPTLRLERCALHAPDHALDHAPAFFTGRPIVRAEQSRARHGRDTSENRL